MKTVYIPKGETVTYESLITEHLIVDGCLKTAYGVKARTISGNGIISAESIAADVIHADELEANTIICKRLMAQRVEAPELFASDSAVVSCYLSAAYVHAGTVTVALSEVDTMNANEVINLPAKNRGMFWTLFLSAFRAVWTRLSSLTEPAMDAEYQPVYDDDEDDVDIDDEPAGSVEAEQESTEPQPQDEELNRFIYLFKLMRESGYTLRVIPGTPEENAPVFDMETEKIIRPAA